MVVCLIAAMQMILTYYKAYQLSRKNERFKDMQLNSAVVAIHSISVLSQLLVGFKLGELINSSLQSGDDLTLSIRIN
jgi:hypothetical protein